MLLNTGAVHWLAAFGVVSMSAASIAQTVTVSPASWEVFERGVVSGPASDAAITFTADGRDALFERGNGSSFMILATRRGYDGWSKPEVVPFSGRWLDSEPSFAPDGSYAVFVSNRPIAPGGSAIDGAFYGKPQPARGGNLWRVDKTPTGWSAPRLLPHEVNQNTSIYEPSLASNGDLYFQMADAAGGRFRLFMARRVGLSYEKAEVLELGGVATSSDMDPAIARDGSYLLFASDRDGGVNKIFVSFRLRERWTAPIKLGEAINGFGPVGDPRFGPDPNRLYFTSRRTRAAAGEPATALREMEAWNNGLPNIWSVSIAALIGDARRRSL